MRPLIRLSIALSLAGLFGGCAAGGPSDLDPGFGDDLAVSPDGDEGLGAGRDRFRAADAYAATPTGDVQPNGDVEPGHHPEPLYAVVLVESDDVLNVRATPGADGTIVDRLPPESTELTGTGRSEMVGDARWVEILTAASSGWVNAHYLTELVTPARFCGDERVTDLLADL